MNSRTQIGGDKAQELAEKEDSRQLLRAATIGGILVEVANETHHVLEDLIMSSRDSECGQRAEP